VDLQETLQFLDVACPMDLPIPGIIQAHQPFVNSFQNFGKIIFKEVDACAGEKTNYTR